MSPVGGEVSACDVQLISLLTFNLNVIHRSHHVSHTQLFNDNRIIFVRPLMVVITFDTLSVAVVVTGAPQLIDWLLVRKVVYFRGASDS